MSTPALTREVFFLDAPGGGRFCLLTRPPEQTRGAILFIHPFAEELNKSRRMVALATSAFARAGWTVLQVDCFGCGDSAGDFSEASWSGWVQDVDLGWRWLQEHIVLGGGMPVVLWTLRSGSLLAADWLNQCSERPSLLMWQPVTNGKQHLTQFLRLKVANEMLVESDVRQVMARVRADLQEGRLVEVAGYGLTADVAGGMEVASLRLPLPYIAPVTLLELGSEGRKEPSPALMNTAGKWTDAGVSVEAEVVAGPAFWQTVEIETAPVIIERSLNALRGLPDGRA